MNKKGFLPLLVPITAGILLVVALILVILFGGIGIITWILAKSIIYLAGIVMLLAGMFLAYKGKIMPLWFWIVGGILIVMPYIFKSLNGLTLGIILG